MDHTIVGILLLNLIFFALTIVLVLALRWFTHRERMASLAQGVSLEELLDKGRSPEDRNKLFLAVGLICTLVGLALSLGLATLGLGPWLLAGLIPFFTGLALILFSLIVRPEKPKEKSEPLVEPQREQDEVSYTATSSEENWVKEEQDEEKEEDDVFF
ncbi:MAG: hypothetical protein GX335_03980 [Firmicutes bacterium]|nr:hypothetical protein [Bacillota bacterium]